MSKTEVHELPLEELEAIMNEPAATPQTFMPDPEVYNAAIAKGATPEQAAHLAMEVAQTKERKRAPFRRLFAKTRKGSDDQPPFWVTFLVRTFVGAFIGLMVGALLMFMALIVALLGWVEVTNGDTLTTVLLIAMTLIGAGLGYASAAKHLRSSDEEHSVPPVPKTA
jgi:hypothetical protein